MSKLDLTLYLVTDSTPAILGDKDIAHVVEEAIKGGVTIVQYRDKHSDTGHLIDVASRIHEITQKHNVPLLINDRIDVCLAIGAEGVHIGQDDMNAVTARKLLPANSIVGVSASSKEEAEKAINDGADYLGIGTMFPTPTKTDTKSILGTRGTQSILKSCNTGTARSVPCVAIGSINASNVQRVLHQSGCDDNRLNGVAVVSAIMASNDPQASAHELAQKISSAGSTLYASIMPGMTCVTDMTQILSTIPKIVKLHFESSVLSHNMTNTVVQNFAANVCLATGASPIMSMNGAEASDLARLGGALVVNMGTVTPEVINVYLAGVKAYNQVGNPVLFDPVGGGATTVRRAAIKTLMQGGFFDLIKGNEGEIGAVAGTSQIQQRGVDSGPSSLNAEQKAELVKSLARSERCLVLMTGPIDYLSDGTRTISVSNGSHWLGKITGSGCALGSVLASYMAVHRKDKFVAALAALLHYEVAAERASESETCKGPGSFIPAFLDELYIIGRTVSEGGRVWFDKRAKTSWM